MPFYGVSGTMFQRIVSTQKFCWLSSLFHIVFGKKTQWQNFRLQCANTDSFDFLDPKIVKCFVSMPIFSLFYTSLFLVSVFCT